MSISESEKTNFITVYQTYVDEVYQYIYLRTGLNNMVAEDITQDIFLDVLKGQRNFLRLCSERTWVFKIARNKLNDFYRKQYSNRFNLIDFDSDMTKELQDPMQDMEQQLMTRFERVKVRKCLELLPEHYQYALLMKYVDEKSVGEIARITGKSVKAAESILTRARNAFMKQYHMLDEEEE